MIEEQVYQMGTTIKLTCKFYDFNEVLKDPSVVKIIFYDYQHKKTNEVALNEGNKIDVGHYYYNYVTPFDEGIVFYEWYGEVDGIPSLERRKIKTVFI